MYDMAPRENSPGPTSAQDGGPASVRLDVWLWSVRVFKTRAAATTACRAGHVRLNQAPVKASQAVRVGDTVVVRRPGWQQVLEVTKLLVKRVGAPVARECYNDLSEPPPPQIRAAVPRRDPGAGRPTKKDRRKLDELRGH
nr:MULTISPECIES: S4 domain-containing protein [Kocuria]